MALLFLLCTLLIQFATGQITANNGQGAFNNLQRSQITNTLSKSPLARGLAASPNNNQLARITDFSNIGTTINGLTNGNQNLASSLANANAASANLDATNLLKSFNLASPNVAHSGYNNQAGSHFPYLSSIASNFNLGSPYTARNYANPSNFASNVANGNIASANNLAFGNQNLAATPNSLAGSGNYPYGIHVQADGLEIGGNIAVHGSMPLYGRVSLNGQLPTGGSATVNYACSG